MATSPSSSWRDSFRSLRHTNFRLYTAGMVVSLVGTWMQSVAQSWLVFRLTRSEFTLGLAGFFMHIPVLLLSPLGGMLADRVSRHRIVLVAQVLLMLQALALGVLALTGLIEVWHVLVLAAVLGSINAFEIPGRQSLFIELVGREDLLNAITLNSAIFNAARIIGPSVAGLLLAGFGEAACFLLNAASFVAVIVCLAAMRLPPGEHSDVGRPLHELVEGFAYAHRTPSLRAILGMSAVINLSSAPAVVLAPVFAEAIFHRGSAGLGLLMGAMGAGAVAGVLTLARLNAVGPLPKVIQQSALLLAGGLTIFAWAPAFEVLVAALGLTGYAVFRHNASANTLIQTIIPDAYRGRIMSIYSMMVVGFLPLGSLAAGAIAEILGARSTVFLGGLLCLASAAAWRLLLPSIQTCVSADEPA